MDKQEITAKLRENEAALRARGVRHAALFGSRAHGDNQPDSDIDIMIESEPEAHIGVFEYAAPKDFIAEFFDAPVDAVSREGLSTLYPSRRDGGRNLCLLNQPIRRCETFCTTSIWQPNSLQD